MRATRLLTAMMLGLLAGACATTSPAEQRAADENRCQSFGFRRGTDPFAKCMLDLDLNRSADRRADLYGYPYGPGLGWGPGWRRW
jgi:hypothetical protein